MRIVNPISINDSNLDSSTIAEPDSTTGEVAWVAGAYVIGDEVIKVSTHRKYRCAVATSEDPEIGVDSSPATWVDIGATNKYAMFDDKNGSKSAGNLSLITETTTNQNVTSVAAFYISGTETANVTLTDPVEGEVYNHDVEMLDSEDIVDYWEWFNLPIINIDQFVLTDLPSYPAATLKVTFTGSGNVSVGTLVQGMQSSLGLAVYGTSSQLVDLSRVDADEFGNYTIVERPYYNLVDYDIVMKENKSRWARNLVAKYRVTPVVWIGGADSDLPRITFGIYNDFQINSTGPNDTKATLQIKELT